MAARASTHSKALPLALSLDACDKLIGRVFTEIGATRVHRTRSPGQLSYLGLLSVEGQTLEVTAAEAASGQCELKLSSRAAAGAAAESDSGNRALEIFERALKRQAGSALKA